MQTYQRPAGPPRPDNPQEERVQPDPDAGLRHINTRIPGDPRPDRANCRYCGRPIQREPHAVEWTANNGPGLPGRNPQRPKAPNPDDAQMPGHAPKDFIVHPN